jgi:hypothetical protein
MNVEDAVFNDLFLYDSPQKKQAQIAKDHNITEDEVRRIRQKHHLTDAVKEIKRIRALWSNKKAYGMFSAFYKWYSKGVCDYCGISQSVVKKIVEEGWLKSRRFPRPGVKAVRGENRGLSIEIDKMNPAVGYLKTNCLLACYFCNNDKSDVFDDKQYRLFAGNRKGFLENLYKERMRSSSRS